MKARLFTCLHDLRSAAHTCVYGPLQTKLMRGHICSSQQKHKKPCMSCHYGSYESNKGIGVNEWQCFTYDARLLLLDTSSGCLTDVIQDFVLSKIHPIRHWHSFKNRSSVAYSSSVLWLSTWIIDNLDVQPVHGTSVVKSHLGTKRNTMYYQEFCVISLC